MAEQDKMESPVIENPTATKPEAAPAPKAGDINYAEIISKLEAAGITAASLDLVVLRVDAFLHGVFLRGKRKP